MPLTRNQKNFISLVSRSPDVGDGWRMVSQALEKHTQSYVRDLPDLFEVKRDNEQFMLRFSEEGKIVAKYL